MIRSLFTVPPPNFFEHGFLTGVVVTLIIIAMLRVIFK